MLILGIDTSTDICSVGLCNKKDFIGEININLNKRHSERLLPIIKRLLSESGYDINNIEGIAVTDGPGSFTGLRIGLSTVQAFKQALNIPVFSLSTLKYMAYYLNKFYVNSIFIPTIDARHKRVYTSLFKQEENNKNLKRLYEDKALKLDNLENILKKYNEKKIIFGSGVEQYKEYFNNLKIDNINIIEDIYNIGGYNLASLGYENISKGESTDYDDLVPKYLKKPQARINWEKKYLQGDNNGVNS